MSKHTVWNHGEIPVGEQVLAIIHGRHVIAIRHSGVGPYPVEYVGMDVHGWSTPQGVTAWQYLPPVA